MGLFPKISFNKNHPGIKKIKELMLPVIFGSSVTQINLIFDTIIASFLITGSISWLYMSDRFIELPLALFGISIATFYFQNYLNIIIIQILNLIIQQLIGA
jgi:putative peptidoglycan lipid II flippase